MVFSRVPPSFCLIFLLLSFFSWTLQTDVIDVIAVNGVIGVIGVIHFCKGPPFLFCKIVFQEEKNIAVIDVIGVIDMTRLIKYLKGPLFLRLEIWG